MFCSCPDILPCTIPDRDFWRQIRRDDFHCQYAIPCSGQSAFSPDYTIFPTKWGPFWMCHAPDSRLHAACGSSDDDQGHGSASSPPPRPMLPQSKVTFSGVQRAVLQGTLEQTGHPNFRWTRESSPNRWKNFLAAESRRISLFPWTSLHDSSATFSSYAVYRFPLWTAACRKDDEAQWTFPRPPWECLAPGIPAGRHRRLRGSAVLVTGSTRPLWKVSLVSSMCVFVAEAECSDASINKHERKIISYSTPPKYFTTKNQSKMLKNKPWLFSWFSSRRFPRLLLSYRV